MKDDNNRVAQPFFFLVVFWGQEYREYFTDYCLASLMAEQNIPSLQKDAKNKFLICTSSADWQELKNYKIFQEMKKFIEPEWVELDLNEHNPEKIGIQLTMSVGHRLLVNAAYRARAWGIFLFPDIVISNGTISNLQTLASTGQYDVIEMFSVRFANSGLMDELKEHNYIQRGKALTITSRNLVQIALRNKQSEIGGVDWSSHFKPAGGRALYFPIVPGKAIQLHCAGYVPLLVNYAALGKHDTSTFDHWTLDGDYIARNFQNQERIYCSKNADELLLIGFTDERKRGYPLFVEKERLLTKFEWINQIFRDKTIVEAWRERFNIPIKVYGCNVSALSIKLTEIKAKIYFWLAEGWRYNAVKYVLTCWYQIINLFDNPLMLPMLHPRGHLFMNTLAIGTTHGVRLDIPLTEKTYWEIHALEMRDELAPLAGIGLVDEKHPLNKELGSEPGGWGFRADGVVLSNGIETNKLNPIPTNITNLVYMVAYDKKQGKLWFGLNGNWFNKGDPFNDQNPTFQEVYGKVYPAITALRQGFGTIGLMWKLTTEEWQYQAPLTFQECCIDEKMQAIPIRIVTSKIPRKMAILKIYNELKVKIDSMLRQKIKSLLSYFKVVCSVVFGTDRR